MSNNQDILKQIQALEGVIHKEKVKRKQASSTNFPPSSTSSSSFYKPSRNLTLINRHESGQNVNTSSSTTTPTVFNHSTISTVNEKYMNHHLSSTTTDDTKVNQVNSLSEGRKNHQFIKKGNKLVRVAAPTSTSLNHAQSKIPNTKSLKRKLAIPNSSVNKRLVIVDGKSYKSSGNKLIATDLVNSMKKKKLRQSRIIEIGGVSFIVKGKKLIRKTDDSKTTPLKGNVSETFNKNLLKTPKKVELNGVQYFRSKSGNLVRAPDPKSKKWKREKKQYCQFFSRLGECKSQGKCRYVHDPKRVTICTKYLAGKCSREPCPFSHLPSDKNTPECIHIVTKSKCNNPNCKYIHKLSNISLSSSATGSSDIQDQTRKICPTFLNHGYCEKGFQCPFIHFFTCPEFFEKGFCGTVKCKFRHDLDPQNTLYEHSTDQEKEEEANEDYFDNVHLKMESENVLREGNINESNEESDLSSSESDMEEDEGDVDDVGDDTDEISSIESLSDEGEDFIKIYFDSDEEDKES